VLRGKKSRQQAADVGGGLGGIGDDAELVHGNIEPWDPMLRSTNRHGRYGRRLRDTTDLHEADDALRGCRIHGLVFAAVDRSFVRIGGQLALPQSQECLDYRPWQLQ
jgi:hypothetical protein